MAESRGTHPSYEPDYAVPTGETLLEKIEELGMTQADLAVRLGLTEKHVSQIVHGKAPVTQETAILLERVTGVPAGFWNVREAIYRERLARVDDTARLQADLAWLDTIPTGELLRRKAIARQSDRTSLLRETLRFFGVSSREAWSSVWENPAAAARKSPAFAVNPGAVAAWMRLGEIEAQAVVCKPYDRERFMASLHSIRGLTVADPGTFVPKMTAACAVAGVALALVPEMKGAPLSGLMRWLTPQKAMIQLSLRYKSDDQFWFSFFHEGGHVLHDQKKKVFIHENSASGPEETKANQFAADFLIPPEHDSQLPGLQTRTAVKEFAKRIGISPGIVVGRLQKEGIIHYSYMNDLKRRFVWSTAA